MKIVFFRIVTVAFVSVALFSPNVNAAPAPLPVKPKVCVYLGWDALRASVQDVYEHRELFAKTGFDGLAMNVNGVRADGRGFFGRRVMASHRFDRGQFNDVIPLIKKLLVTEGLKESLFAVYWMGTSKRRIGWADDAAWAEFYHNMSFVCSFAKELGFKGLFIDHEDYTGKPLFKWNKSADPSYKETVALARRRGVETAQAMSKGDENVRFLFERSLLQLAGSIRSQTPHETSALEGDLWYPFLNGFVEGMTPGMKLIEGCESGYGARIARDYRALIGECRYIALEMLEPQLRAKYIAQSEMGFGKYLDGWVKRKYSLEVDIPTTLFGAGVYSESLFWVYGEGCSVVPWKKKMHPRSSTMPWSEKFPGLPELLRVSVGDYSALRAKAAANELVNLVSNPGCEAKGKGKVPSPFQVWTAKKTKESLAAHDAAVGCSAAGSIKYKPGAGCITFKAGGISPGDKVYATFCAKGRDVLGDVVWVKGGAWQWKKDYQFLAKASEELKDGWKRYECALIAPEDVDGVGFIISARPNEGECAWFDDISIYRW